jgi:hypothetical protein
MNGTPLQHVVKGVIHEDGSHYSYTAKALLKEIKLHTARNYLFGGIFITENLTGHVQIHSLRASLSKAYYIIKPLRDVMSTHMLWSIYFAYFQSRLWNRILFWGSVGETTQVFRLQKRMIRVITGEHKRETCRHIFGNFES